MVITPLSSTGNILLDGQAIPALQYRRIQFSKDYYYRRNRSAANKRIMSNCFEFEPCFMNVVSRSKEKLTSVALSNECTEDTYVMIVNSLMKGNTLKTG